MKIEALIELLPDSVKTDIADFTDCKLKDGRYAVRVLMDRLLTDDEKKEMSSDKIIGVDCVAYYKSAPEIKKSYFYVVS